MENKYEEPHTEWVHETGHDTLVLYLPGYNKEQLKVQVTTRGKVRISGERLIGENESIRFRQEFPVPENYDTNGISASFKDGILNIKLPKSSQPEAEKPKPLLPSQEPPKSEEHEKPAKEMPKLEEQKLEEKPKIDEEKKTRNDESSKKVSEMGKNDGNGESGGKVTAGEIVHGKTPDVKQVLDGLVKEVRNPRRVWNLMVALFMVWVLLLYIRKAYLSMFGGFGSEN